MVFESSFTVEEPDKRFKDLVSEFFWHQLDVFANKTLLVDYLSGCEWTGAQIKETSGLIARYFVEEADLKPADNCVFFADNSDRLHVVQLGVLFAGASVCAGWYKDPESELDHMLNSMKPAIVFADSSIIDTLLKIRASRVDLSFKICIVDDEKSAKFYGKQILSLHSDVLTYKPTRNIQLPVNCKPDDAAYVLFTSGSTGRPKPVARSQRNSLYVCHSLNMNPNPLWHLDQNSVLAGHLPLDHGTGTFSVKMMLAKGSKLIVMEHYDFETMLTAIEKYRITDCMLGSALIHNLISAPEQELAKFDLSSLRNLMAVGSRIASPATVNEFMEKHPNVSIRQTFGMTEVGFMCIVERDQARSAKTGVGCLLPNVTVKLLDIESNEQIIEYDKDGELFVKGPTVSPGYMGSELVEQTKAVFLPDGFYRSYDLCSVNPEGRLIVKGRITDVLCLYDGWKVLPAEIESVLLEHEAVLETAVIGLPHPTLPTCHAPRAFAVLKEAWQGKVTARELQNFANSKLSSAKHLIGGVRILDSLPRVSIGKVDKRALKQIE